MELEYAITEYEKALREGKEYYKSAVSDGKYPYPTVLDEILSEDDIVSRADLGIIDIPSRLIVGTKSAGRTAAFAGNFMPLLDRNTEFAMKWIRLCDAHLGDEGIRDAITCYEYLGRFYVQEGNKRVSVLRHFGSPTVPARVTRLVPAYSDEHEVQVYYEFLHFYSLSKLYNVKMNHRGEYARLQALLGFDEDQVWSEDQRLSFSAGYNKFRRVYRELVPSGSGAMGGISATAGEALLTWLKVFSFQDIKNLSESALFSQLSALMPDIRDMESEAITLRTSPRPHEKNFISRLLGVGQRSHVRAAFVYAFAPEESGWSYEHEQGRLYAQRRLGDRLESRAYTARDGNYLAVMEQAIDEGADIILATAPPMIDACRHIKAQHPEVKVLNCALSQPYSYVRMYYCRTYETKFIAGAVAGAMTGGERIRYLANAPIFGTLAEINAFALGARLTNPNARIELHWSCLPGETLAFSDPTVTTSFRWGTFYEQVLLSLFDGTWVSDNEGRAINYWWGMDSGMIDIKLRDDAPQGVQRLASVLRGGIIRGDIHPFDTNIKDQTGALRCDSEHPLSSEDILRMDWLCDCVDGAIPSFEELAPMARPLVRILGIYRDRIAPEKEEVQL